MHIKNFTKAQKGHILGHNENAKIRSKLKHVDPTLTKYNYSLCERNIKSIEYWEQRYKESKHSNQKKTTVMTDIVLTQPKGNYTKEQSKQFFETSYKFLSERYGVQNVVSAIVHLDEINAQPHLHLCIIPINEQNRCSARGIFSREELQKVHIELQKWLDSSLDFEVPILNGATANGNKTIQQLKSETNEKQLQEIKEKIQQEKQIYKFLKSENEKMRNESIDISKLKNENEELKKMLSNTVSAQDYNKVVKAYNSKTQEVKEYKEYVDEFETYLNKKGLFRDFLNYSTNQNENQKNKHFDIEK